MTQEPDQPRLPWLTESGQDISGFPLDHFSKLTEILSREQFLRRFPQPFLVQAPDSGQQSFRSIGLTTEKEAAQDIQFLHLSEPESHVYLVVDRGVNHFTDMITVGRAPNNDIYIHSSKVSKFHAYFECHEGVWTLRDCGSSNGTFIEDVALEPRKPQPLNDGDLITFGLSLRFYFTLPETMFRRTRRS